MSVVMTRPMGAVVGLCACAYAFVPLSTLAQTATVQPSSPLEITVTANRVPTAIQRTGSAITVIGPQDLARHNPGTLVNALRAVPGVDITENGGPGATTVVRLGGANAGQTLVLVDGVRVNDPSGPSGDFDFSTMAPGLIERIEVLRGPQSALYGSDAIGGVINIITRKGRGQPSASLTVEGGSYGTLNTTGAMSGATGTWSYAFAGSASRSDGYSRYGYRIGRLAGAANVHGVRGGGLEADGYARFGGFGRIGYDPGTGFRLDLGLTSVHSNGRYDSAFGAFPDTPAFTRRTFTQGSVRAELDTFGNRLTHSVQIFASRTDREFRDVSLGLLAGNLRQTSRSLTDFNGERRGAEYQATLRLDRFGSLIAGARIERETADSFGTALVPAPGPRMRTLAAEQETRSLFALWQWPVTERLSLSLSGRHDDVSDSGAFNTWRATAAYRLMETDTKLRASAGSGGKAPTLFQRFSPQYGTPGLDPERSTGFDIGIDQRLFDGRITLSATAFLNRMRDLIDFEAGPRCLPTQVFGCYVNVARATTSGVELSGRAELVPGLLSLTGTYTYLHAKDSVTNRTLARRAPHVGRLALQINPTAAWTIEPSLTLVSGRFSGASETQRLAPYARFDVLTEYRFNDRFKAHVRAENITNARYQEVFNYGTTGRAVYGGLTATW